jgi:hypothetical protein
MDTFYVLWSVVDGVFTFLLIERGQHGQILLWLCGSVDG